MKIELVLIAQMECDSYVSHVRVLEPLDTLIAKSGEDAVAIESSDRKTELVRKASLSNFRLGVEMFAS